MNIRISKTIIDNDHPFRKHWYFNGDEFKIHL